MEQGKVDVITYCGAINSTGYDKISSVIRSKRRGEQCILVLATPGGEPDAGFRIARALQHTYDGFGALVPRYCKSAGTLILTGASVLFLDDMSELGPLDVQLKKNDELLGRNSGLDIAQAINRLKSLTLEAFDSYLLELTIKTRLSTKVASDMAARLTCGLLEPIASQIDPIKMAEAQRATEIAIEYGTRLAEKGGNIFPPNLIRLVTGYPSHSFVIDRKEARDLFKLVLSPTPELRKIGRKHTKDHWSAVNSPSPTVDLETVDIEAILGNQENPHGPAHEDPANVGDGEASPPDVVGAVPEDRSSGA